MKVIQVTSAHPRDDVRIFWKFARTSNKNFNSLLIVCDGLEDDLIDDVQITGLKRYPKRWKRILFSPFRIMIYVLKNIKKENTILHFHDPELLLVSLLLSISGYKTIFDFHEDFPSQLKTKQYIPKTFRVIIGYFYEQILKLSAKKIKYFIGATEFITRNLPKKDKATVNNYPMIKDYEECSKLDHGLHLVYIGGLSEIRGIRVLINALEKCKNQITLHIYGSFENEDFKNEIIHLKGWKKVKYYGQINREVLLEKIPNYHAGVVTFLPVENHINSQPNKLFEYLERGLPVICSNFPKWEEVILEFNCGISVDPTAEESIINTLDLLNGYELQKWSIGSRKAIMTKYSWNAEGKKLLNIYTQL